VRALAAFSALALCGILVLASCEGSFAGLEMGMGSCTNTLVGRVTKPGGGGKKGVEVQFYGADETPMSGSVKTNDRGRYTLKSVGPHWWGDPSKVRFSKQEHILWEAAPRFACDATETLDVVWRWG
jgi:hypothetical protein